MAGIILGPTEKANAEAEAVLRAGIPLVTIDRRIAELELDAVTTDSDAGISAAVEHLYGHGHRAIGFIGGPLDASTGRRRQEAFFAALRRLGLVTSSEWVARADFREHGGQRAALEMLSARNRPTALFVANEMMTLGALRAVRELGLSMPADLAVIGFDDTPWARLLDPPLTVVAQPAYELGRLAAEALLRRLGDPGRHAAMTLLAPRFLVRASCGDHRSNGTTAADVTAADEPRSWISAVPSRPRGHARGV